MEAEPDNSIEAATDNASAVVIQDGISQAARYVHCTLRYELRSQFSNMHVYTRACFLNVTFGRSAGTEMVPMGGSSREEVVKFIIRDETNSNWKTPKCSQSLSHSTAVADLYTAVAKESGTHLVLY